MSEEKEKELTPIELEDQMFQLRLNIEAYEDKKADLRKQQAKNDENFDAAQSQLRQLHYYDLPQADTNLFSDIMQRQMHLRLQVQEETDKRMKTYQQTQESLDEELTGLRKVYNDLFESKKQ
ncbi:hypothetical protein ACVR1G_07455 [Streptococcus dentasini]